MDTDCQTFKILRINNFKVPGIFSVSDEFIALTIEFVSNLETGKLETKKIYFIDRIPLIRVEESLDKVPIYVKCKGSNTMDLGKCQLHLIYEGDSIIENMAAASPVLESGELSDI